MNNFPEPFVACGTYLFVEPPLSCEKTPPPYLFIWRLDAAGADGRRRRITFSNVLQEYIFVNRLRRLAGRVSWKNRETVGAVEKHARILPIDPTIVWIGFNPAGGISAGRPYSLRKSVA